LTRPKDGNSSWEKKTNAVAYLELRNFKNDFTLDLGTGRFRLNKYFVEN
jgi:hypothetical protein